MPQTIGELLRSKMARRSIEQALEQISPGLTAQAWKAANSRLVISIKAERKLAEAEPLCAAALGLSLAIIEAQVALGKARLVALEYPESSVHRWIERVETGLQTAGPPVASPHDLAKHRNDLIPTGRVRPAPTVDTIETRVMPSVRVAVHRVIKAAVDRSLAQARLNGKTLRDDTAALRLTAEFIKAYFLGWGRTTTVEKVRKAVQSHG